MYSLQIRSKDEVGKIIYMILWAS